MTDECGVYFGDLVIYSNRQSLERRQLTGLVMGRALDGKMLVLWVRPSGRTEWSYHEWPVLRVVSAATRHVDSAEVADTAMPSVTALSQSLRT